MGKIRPLRNRVIGSHFCALATLVIFITPLAEASPLCKAWEMPTEIGKLDTKLLDEASGMALSRTSPRLYLINDSGSGPSFIVNSRDGAGAKKITINGFKPFDTEDLALGPCPVGEQATCLIVGDIGDNRRKRKTVELVFIQERAEFGAAVDPVAKFEARYPDGAHNAEALGSMPNGDLVIVTKEEDKKKEVSLPAQVFRLSKREIEGAITAKKVATLERLGEIDVPTITKNKSFGGLVTGMSVSQDGTRWLLLTYENAIEVVVDPKFDPASKKPVAIEHKLVPLKVLPQQESITYETNDRDFLYTTELMRGLFASTKDAPVMGAKCKE